MEKCLIYKTENMTRFYFIRSTISFFEIPKKLVFQHHVK
jgi:hypothetical protein